MMRASDERTEPLPGHVGLEASVWEDHPLRTIREVSDAALGELAEELARLRPERPRRPPIPPERLLRAMLLQAFYSIPSEQLMDRLELDPPFRRFAGLRTDEAVWDYSTFAANRDQLLAGAIARKFLAAVIAHPQVKRLLASEHFSVDGMLLMAWASGRALRRA